MCVCPLPRGAPFYGTVRALLSALVPVARLAQDLHISPIEHVAVKVDRQDMIYLPDKEAVLRCDE